MLIKHVKFSTLNAGEDDYYTRIRKLPRVVPADTEIFSLNHGDYNIGLAGNSSGSSSSSSSSSSGSSGSSGDPDSYGFMNHDVLPTLSRDMKRLKKNDGTSLSVCFNFSEKSVLSHTLYQQEKVIKKEKPTVISAYIKQKRSIKEKKPLAPYPFYLQEYNSHIDNTPLNKMDIHLRCCSSGSSSSTSTYYTHRNKSPKLPFCLDISYMKNEKKKA
ncbi:hypothetical protein BDF14DRAFT_1799474 [Spinellus fusiger]|nr:hypothetical protein BDF14DRAFT_1799474 [Spinellus fusiger]